MRSSPVPTRSRSAHRDRADAGHNLTLGQVTVAHQPLTSIVGQLVGVASRNPATSVATAWARSARAPLRSTSVSGSESVPGWESWKTLLSVTAYHSFSGQVEARAPHN